MINESMSLRSKGNFPLTALPGLDRLWEETLGEKEVMVAFLDGPVELSHPCFRGAKLSEDQNLKPQAAASDHGTHVASLVLGQHGTGVLGIAPKVQGLSIPVFEQLESGGLRSCSQKDLATGIAVAMEKGASIINISGGELTPAGEATDFLRDAVKQAADRNVLIVSAVGNEGCECLHVPAVLPSVLAVGALGSDGLPSPTSNWSSVLYDKGLLAPGTLIPGAVTGGRTGLFSGTSFATPLVAGVAALLLSLQKAHGQKMNPAAVRDALLGSVKACKPRGGADCSRFLKGILDIAAARDFLLVENPSRSLKTKALKQGTRGVPSISVSPSTLKGENMDNAEFESPITPVSEAVEASSIVGTDESMGTSAHVETVPLEAASPETGLTLSSDDSVPMTDSAESSSHAVGLLLPTSGSALPDRVISHARVTPSCNGISTFSPFPPGQKVFVLGRLYYDFGTEARRDYYVAQIRSWWEHREDIDPREEPFNPGMVYNPKVMVDYLFKVDTSSPDDNNLDQAPGLIFTMYIDQDPVYALVPEDQYAVISFLRLLNGLKAQMDLGESALQETFRFSVAGTLEGNVTLLNGTVVPKIALVTRAIYYWDIKALMEDLQPQGAGYEDELKNFLLRIYYELRNLGVTADERAKNFAGTNAYQAKKIFQETFKKGLRLDKIAFSDSPICRRNAICRDIKLIFFNPDEMFQAARTVYEYTIDVSDLVPVQVGDMRSYEIYGGPGA